MLDPSVNGGAGQFRQGRLEPWRKPVAFLHELRTVSRAAPYLHTPVLGPGEDVPGHMHRHTRLVVPETMLRRAGKHDVVGGHARTKNPVEPPAAHLSNQFLNGLHKLGGKTTGPDGAPMLHRVP